MGSRPVPDGFLALEPGRIIGLTGSPGAGMTRLGLSLMADVSRLGPVAFVDTRGWFSPLSAWESGIEPDRLAVVRCHDNRRWPRVVAALVEGLGAVYAEVPSGVSDGMLRRLGALVRNRRRSLVLRPVRGGLPAGLAHLRLDARGVEWEGADAGHGRLTRRRLLLEASGKATGGMPLALEIREGGERDAGANAVRVVPRLVSQGRAGSAAG